MVSVGLLGMLFVSGGKFEGTMGHVPVFQPSPQGGVENPASQLPGGIPEGCTLPRARLGGARRGERQCSFGRGLRDYLVL